MDYDYELQYGGGTKRYQRRKSQRRKSQRRGRSRATRRGQRRRQEGGYRFMDETRNKMGRKYATTNITGNIATKFMRGANKEAAKERGILKVHKNRCEQAKKELERIQKGISNIGELIESTAEFCQPEAMNPLEKQKELDRHMKLAKEAVEPLNNVITLFLKGMGRHIKLGDRLTQQSYMKKHRSLEINFDDLTTKLPNYVKGIHQALLTKYNIPEQHQAAFILEANNLLAIEINKYKQTVNKEQGDIDAYTAQRQSGEVSITDPKVAQPQSVSLSDVTLDVQGGPVQSLQHVPPGQVPPPSASFTSPPSPTPAATPAAGAGAT